MVVEDGLYRACIASLALLSMPFESHLEPQQLWEWMKQWRRLPPAISSIYLLILYLGVRWMATRPAVHLPRLRTLWNVALSLFSAVALTRIAPPLFASLASGGLTATMCTSRGHDLFQGHSGLWIMLGALSKVVELADTAFLVLQRKDLTVLHVWHHASVLVMSWYQCLQLSGPVPLWAAMNMLIHAVMYFYFVLVEWELLSPLRLRRLAMTITFTQTVQMVIGLAAVALAMYRTANGADCRLNHFDALLCGSVYFSYLVLFVDFADRTYGLRARIASTRGQQMLDVEVLDETDKFQVACSRAPLLIGFMSTDEALRLYGLYKQVTCGDSAIRSAVHSNVQATTKFEQKLHAWSSCRGHSAAQCQDEYVQLIHAIESRAKVHKHPSQGLQQRTVRGGTCLWRVRISGVGHYLPRQVVTNADVEKIGHFEPGSTESRRIGVNRRHRAAPTESASSMAAIACLEALKAAGVDVSEVDCILNASGTSEQSIPDGGPLLQSALGLQESGIPAFSVQATCLSFLVALETAAGMLARQDGRYKTILIAAAEITSAGVDASDPHTAPLFGDGAAAAVVQRSSHEQCSCIHEAHMSTFSGGKSLIEIRAGGTQVPPYSRDHSLGNRTPNPEHTYDASHFQMDGEGTLHYLAPRMAKELETLAPGLSQALENIDWVIPHQASGLALDSLALFNWPSDRVLRTLHRCGNCVAASIPLTLYHGIAEGQVKRGDRLLLCGTSAGLSFGGMILTF